MENKQQGGHKGYGRNKETVERRRKQILELYKSGMSPIDIANTLGFKSASTVYSVVHRFDVYERRDPAKLGVDQLPEIARLVTQGTAYADIARKYDVDEHTVRNYCRANELKLSDDQKSKNCGKFSNDQVSRIVDDKDLGLEYVSGYVNYTTPFLVRCKACGHEFETRINRKPACPVCMEARKREASALRNEASEKRKLAREKVRAGKELAKKQAKEKKLEARSHPCVVCGKLTARPRYRSGACQKRVRYKQKEMKRRAKISGALVDHDITIHGLFRRDAGRCHICGLQCSWDDYTQRDGVIICGDWYPSIDHVIPLAKGGLHEWDNVKLAHRRCNSLKGDQIEGEGA